MQTTKRDAARCDCRNINAEMLNETVWEYVRSQLLDRSALTAMAKELAGGPKPDGAEQISSLTDQLAALRMRVANEYQGALDAGFDAETARMMVKGRQAEVKSLEKDLGTAHRVQTRALRASVNAPAMSTLMEQVKLQVDDPVVRGDVLDALNVGVKVVGFEPCQTCRGKGCLPLAPGGGRRWPPMCPACRRMRMLPVVEVRMTAPEALLALAGMPDEAVAG